MDPLVKHADGRVTRLGRCTCGTPLYRKDLTNNRFEFLRRDRRKTSALVIETGDKCKIHCPNCELSHTILHIRETVTGKEKVRYTLKNN